MDEQGRNSYVIPEGFECGGVRCKSPVEFSVLRWRGVFAGDYIHSKILPEDLRVASIDEAGDDDLDTGKAYSVLTENFMGAVRGIYLSLMEQGEAASKRTKGILSDITRYFDFSGLSKV